MFGRLLFRVGQAFCVRWRMLLGFFAILLLVIAIRTSRKDRHAFAVLSSLGVKTLPRFTEPRFPPLSYGCMLDEGQTPWTDKVIACANFPAHLLSTTQIVIKTGAADRDKTRGLLETIALCVPRVLIVSDASDSVNGHEVIDVLADLPPSYAINNTDWAAYTDQKELLAAGKEVGKTYSGWKLDRFKFLPMVERAFQQQTDAKWYIFIESDVYFFWDTAFRLLDLLDHNEYHYIGAPAPAAHGLNFAYGGGGFIMSHKLVFDLMNRGLQKPSVKFEQLVKDDCCGDAVLTYVIHKELGIRMESLYPTFSGEEPAWLRIHKDNWCIPLLGLHRISAERAARLWRWERCRPYTDQPITYATFLDHIIASAGEAERRLDWDNRPDYRFPADHVAHDSARACEIACEADSGCLQYRYSHDDGCSISGHVSEGIHVEDNSKGFVSGISLAHLEKLGFVKGKDPGTFCEQPQWLVPKIV